MPVYVTGVDGLEYVAEPSSNFSSKIDWGWGAGHAAHYVGQTGNTAAGNVANQGVGTAAIPAIASGATGTVTITDSKITALSLIFTNVKRGTTTAAAGALASIVAANQPPASGSCVIDVRNAGTAATLSTDYVLHYWVVN